VNVVLDYSISSPVYGRVIEDIYELPYKKRHRITLILFSEAHGEVQHSDPITIFFTTRMLFLKL